MPTQPYSWRISDEIRSALERRSRALKKPISQILELAVRDWLDKSGDTPENDAETQRRLHAESAKFFGVYRSGNPDRAQNARQIIRKRLRDRHDRAR